MKIRTVIVDDMALARRRIRRHLENDPDIEIVAECSGGREAIEAIEEHGPHLAFLDVQMPEVDGFAVVEAVGPGAVPAVVFVTAYDEFAMRAFEVHALDYLLKPFDSERFRATLARAKAQIARSVATPAEQKLRALLDEVRGASRFATRLAIRSKEKTIFVAVGEIDYIEASGNYLQVQAGSESHLMRETMSSVEAKLDPQRFARIHRSTIVNLSRIRELHPLFNGDHVLVLRSGKRLTVSRTYRDALLERLERV